MLETKYEHFSPVFSSLSLVSLECKEFSSFVLSFLGKKKWGNIWIGEEGSYSVVSCSNFLVTKCMWKCLKVRHGTNWMFFSFSYKREWEIVKYQDKGAYLIVSWINVFLLKKDCMERYLTV